jgi:MFS transporter, FHS family, L-fucose permease
MRNRALPVFLVFLAMGFGDVVQPMVSLAEKTFDLSHVAGQLLTSAGLIMFGVLSVPMGVLQDRRGKKLVLIGGLVIALVGLLIPMFAGMYGPAPEIIPGDKTKFYVLLGSIFLLGTGATMLQVVGNPLVRDVSPAGAYSRNLSLAQAIKAIGSSMGFLLPTLAVMAFGLDWPLLFPIYSAIIIVTLLLNLPMQIHETRDPNAKPATFASCFALLFGNVYILMMVLGIFLYVGAEMCFGSRVPSLLDKKFHIEGFNLWVGWSLFMLPILAGRFSGAAVLRTMSARKFFILTTVLATVGIVCVLTGIESLAFVGIVLAGLGFANIFPLIFSITIDYMPQRANEISGLMISAIVGGAVLPLAMGLVIDEAVPRLGEAAAVQSGFVVPLAALAYICVLAVVNLKSRAAGLAPKQ